MSFLEQPFKLGTSGSLYKNIADPGSMLFGGAGKSNSLGQKRDGNDAGLFGDRDKGIDWFGSPVTAGTNSQGPARLAAILYGAYMAAGAMGAGGAGAGGGAAAGGTGAGAGMGAAEGGGLLAGGGEVGSGYAASAPGAGYGTQYGTISKGGLFGSGTTSAQSAPTAGGASNFMNYARMGNAMRQMGGGGQRGAQQSQPIGHQFYGGQYRNPYMQGYPWGA